MAKSDFQVRISADVSDLQKELRQLKSQLAGVAHNSAVGSRAMRDFEKTNKSFASSIAGSTKGIVAFSAGFGVYSAIRQSFTGLLDTTKQVERLKISLELATGSAARAEMKFRELDATARALALPQFELTKAYADFAIAARSTSLAGSEVDETFERIARAAAGAQIDSDQFAGVMRALNQIMSKGSVQAEELRGQLGDRLTGAFGLAAEAMGVTTAELDKMLKSGSVAAEDFLPKFAKTLEDTFGSGAQKRVEGLTGALINTKDAFVDLGVALSQSGFAEVTTTGINAIEDAVRSLTDNLEVVDGVLKGLASLIAGRMVASLTASASATTANVVAARAASSAWVAMGGAATTASIGATALSRAMGLLGGPVGIAATAAAGIYAYVSSLESAADRTREINDLFPELIRNIEKVGTAGQIQQLQKRFTALSELESDLLDQIDELRQREQKQLGKYSQIKNLKETRAELASTSAEYENISHLLNVLQQKLAALQGQAVATNETLSDTPSAFDENVKALRAQIAAYSSGTEAVEAWKREQQIATIVTQLAKDGTEEQKNQIRLLAAQLIDAQTAFKKLNKEVVLSRDITDRSIDTTDRMTLAYERAAERIENVFADLFRSLLTDTSNFGEALVASIREFAVNDLVGAFRTGDFGGINPFSFGSGVGSLEQGVEFLGNRLMDIGEEFGLEAADKLGGTLLNNAQDIGNGIGLAALGALGNVAAFRFGSALGENAGINGNAAGAGAVLAPELVLSNLITSALTDPGSLDNVVNSIIGGGKTRVAENILTVMFDSVGFNAETLTKLERRKNRWDDYDPAGQVLSVQDELAASLDGFFSPIMEGLQSAADTFGADISGIAFSLTEDINGLDQDEITALLQDALIEFSDTVAQQILPNIDELSVGTETYAQTLARVTESTSTAVVQFARLGVSLSTVNLAEVATDMVELAGGAQAFASAVDTLISDFASEAEQSRILMHDLAEGLGGIAEQLPATRDAFYELFQTMGPEQQGLLLGSIDLINDYYDAIEEGSRSIQATRDALIGVTTNTLLDRAFDSFTQGIAGAIFNPLLRAAREGGEALADSASRFSDGMLELLTADMVTALNAVANSADEANREAEALASTLRSTFSDIQRQITGLNGGSLALFDIDSVNAAIAAATTMSEVLALIPQAQQALTALYNEQAQAISDNASAAIDALREQDRLRQEADREHIAAIEAQIQASEQMQDIARGLREYLAGLARSEFAGTPLDQITEGRAQLQSLFSAFQGGDQSAGRQLQSLAQELLSTGRDAFASGPQFQALLAEVTGTLEAAAAFGEAQTVPEQQLSVLEQLRDNADSNTEAQIKAIEDARDAQLEVLRGTFAGQLTGLLDVVAGIRDGEISELADAQQALIDAIKGTTNAVLAVDTSINGFVASFSDATIEVEALLKYLADDTELPQDLKDLALMGSQQLDITLDFIAGARLSADLEQLALNQAVLNTRTIRFVAQSELPADLKEIALATSSTIQRTVNAVFDSEADQDAIALALNTANSLTTTVGAVVSSGADPDAMALGLETTNQIATTVDALRGNVPDDVYALALSHVNTISSTVNAAFGNLDPDVQRVLLDQAGTYTATLDAALADGVLSDDERAVLAAIGGDTQQLLLNADVALNPDGSLSTPINSMRDSLEQIAADIRASLGIQDDQGGSILSLTRNNNEQLQAIKARLEGIYGGVDSGTSLAAIYSKLTFSDGRSWGGLNQQQLQAINDNTKLSNARGYATGGFVSGPGTGTSDSIRANLSNGEFVMQASAVDAFGVGFMDRINAGQVPVAPVNINNNAMAAEIRALRAEVAALRSDQRSLGEGQLQVQQAGFSRLVKQGEKQTKNSEAVARQAALAGAAS